VRFATFIASLLSLDDGTSGGYGCCGATSNA
jgi:hypothetical protein